MKPFANPVRPRTVKSRASELYPYYAGFSSNFAKDAVQWLNNSSEFSILDPWNGAGTTTSLAKSFPAYTIGYDLNPVMVIVSKSNLAVPHEAGSIGALTEKISTLASKRRILKQNNPLTELFTDSTAAILSNYAISIWKHLVSVAAPTHAPESVSEISPLAAAFYVGLFNTIRQILTPLSTSNPTWTKLPRSAEAKIAASSSSIRALFTQSMERIGHLIFSNSASLSMPRATCSLGDAKKIPLEDHSVDSILTSPPYCTRLDYARATLPELLVLESIGLASYASTRLSLMGSSITAKPSDPSIPEKWGTTCEILLDQIHNHPSKASRTYYFYSHHNYFADLQLSISEMSRVCKPGARICIVAQDSYYKEVHNDLPKIITEMASIEGFQLSQVFSYTKKNPISLINRNSKSYNQRKPTTESAILLTRS